MRSKYPHIEEELKKHGISNRQLAGELGISELALYRRRMGISKWTLFEGLRLCKIFGCTDIYYLFEREER